MTDQWHSMYIGEFFNAHDTKEKIVDLVRRIYFTTIPEAHSYKLPTNMNYDWFIVKEPNNKVNRVQETIKDTRGKFLHPNQNHYFIVIQRILEVG